MFRAGSCDANTALSFQGAFHDVNFMYGLEGSNIYKDSTSLISNLRTQRLAQIPLPIIDTSARKVHTIISEPISRTLNEPEKQLYLQNLDGPEEYSVSGWFKWTKISNQ